MRRFPFVTPTCQVTKLRASTMREEGLHVLDAQPGPSFTVPPCLCCPGRCHYSPQRTGQRNQPPIVSKHLPVRWTLEPGACLKGSLLLSFIFLPTSRAPTPPLHRPPARLDGLPTLANFSSVAAQRLQPFPICIRRWTESVSRFPSPLASSRRVITFPEALRSLNQLPASIHTVESLLRPPRFLATSARMVDPRPIPHPSPYRDVTRHAPMQPSWQGCCNLPNRLLRLSPRRMSR